MNLLPPAQVFVLMVTAIGSSLFYTLKSLVERPGEFFSLLATTFAILDTFLFELLSFSVVLLPFASDPAFFFHPVLSGLTALSFAATPATPGPMAEDRLCCGGYTLPCGREIFCSESLEGGWKGHRGLRTRGSGPLWPPRFWLEGTVGLIFDLFASSRHHLSSPIPVDSQCMGTILMRRIFKKAGLRT